MTSRRFYRAESVAVAFAFAAWGLAVAAHRFVCAICPCGQHNP